MKGPGGGARRDAAPRVYKVVDGKLTAVPVQVGVADSTYTEIVGGDIKEGDKLVTRDLAGQGGPQSQLRLRMF
jgi:HlyD family secretion protein